MLKKYLLSIGSGCDRMLMVVKPVRREFGIPDFETMENEFKN
jgi:hypothetical protein